MAQIVIPNLPQLSLVFPDGIFELYQQLHVEDVLSFGALMSQDTPVSVTIRKQPNFCTAIDIETESNAGVLELDENRWLCNMREITSEAFLVPGAGEQAKSDVTVKQGEPTNEKAHEVAAGEDAASVGGDSALLRMLQQTSVSSSLPLKEAAPAEVLQLKEEKCFDYDSQTSDSCRVQKEEGSLQSKPLSQYPLDDYLVAVTSQQDGGVRENVADTSKNQTVVTIGKLGKVTVSSKAGVQTFREAKELTRDQAEQVELGPDSLADYESKLRSDNCDSNAPEAVGTELCYTAGEAAGVSTAAEVPAPEVSAAEEDEWAQDEDGVYVLTPERLKKMILSKEEMKKGEHRDPNSVVMNFPILKEGDKFKCWKCGLLLMKKNYLISHMRYVHKTCIRTPLSIFTCRFCHKQFVRKSRLDEHIAHHHNDSKPFACDVEGCSQAFKTQYNLRDHKRITHYHMLRYACSKCGRQYENPNVMVKHYTSCTHGHGEEKTAEELRNPDWIPVEQLFSMPVPSGAGTGRAGRGRGRKRRIKEEEEEEDMKPPISDENDDHSSSIPFEDASIPVVVEQAVGTDTLRLSALTPRKSSRLAGKERTDYSKMAKVEIQDGVGETLVQSENLYLEDRLPMEPKQMTDSSSDVTSSRKIMFRVTSLLSAVAHKTYELGHDEIWRRIYGPETLNASNIAQIASHQASKQTIAFVRSELTKAGFESPKCPPVVSSFSKLCEGEVEDMLQDHAQLLQQFLPSQTLASHLACLLTQGTSPDLAGGLNHMGEVMAAVKDNIREYCTNFDHVTHNLGSEVVTQVIDLIMTSCQVATTRISNNEVDMTSSEKLDEIDYSAGSEEGFDVQGLLSTNDVRYTVGGPEIKRRMGGPEQLSITLLHQYLRRPKHDYNQMVKECVDMGCALQVGNKTKVKSCFTLICEGEGKVLCADLRQLMTEYADLEGLADAVSDALHAHSTLADSHATAESKAKAVRDIQPYIKKAMDRYSKNYSLVTHAMGPEFINISFEFLDAVLTPVTKSKSAISKR